MNKKFTTFKNLPILVRKLRRQKKTLAFTNGTFDILHRGHVDYLQKAKASADILIVGVNSDKSVRAYKGPKRPINPERDRLAVLSALECVDYVVLFSTPTPIKLICTVKPDVLVKGADWKLKDIVGAREVMDCGGKVKRIRFLPNRSSTRIIRALNLEK